MNLTELAHWRYRITALTDELKTKTDLAQELAVWRHMPRYNGIIPVWDEPKPPGQWELELLETAELIRWLIEEAKYKVQVGELENA